MFQRFEITGLHVDLDGQLRKYVTGKLGNLDRYVPRRVRMIAHMDVRLDQTKINRKWQPMCEAVLYMPHVTIRICETGATMQAAIDIVESKLKQQIVKYKEEWSGGARRRYLSARLRRSFSWNVPGAQ